MRGRPLVHIPHFEQGLAAGGHPSLQPIGIVDEFVSSRPISHGRGKDAKALLNGRRAAPQRIYNHPRTDAHRPQVRRHEDVECDVV